MSEKLVHSGLAMQLMAETNSAALLPTSPPSDLPMTWLPLQEVPSQFGMYRRALLTRRSGLERGERLPAFAAQLTLRPSHDWLKKYLDICGWAPRPEQLIFPLTAPQVIAAPVQTYILTHPQFPITPLGIVHAANEISCVQPIELDHPLEVKVWTGETRWKERGFEFDLHTSVSMQREATPRWVARTVIFRSVHSQDRQKSKQTKREVEYLEGEQYSLPLSADQGRKYAPIAGDHNPIHLYPFTAKMFGFKRPIIHGMWTLARVLSSLEHQTRHQEVGTLYVRFKRPLLLPSEATITSITEAKRSVFQVLDDQKRVALEGAVDLSQSGLD